MEGITILNTIEVMGSTWGFSIVGLIVAILALFILIGTILSITKDDDFSGTVLSFLVAATGIFISLICGMARVAVILFFMT